MEGYLGEIRIFAGTYAPENWAFCQGQQLTISDFAALYSILGVQYGGNGTTNFKLPNLQCQVPVCAGSFPGLTTRIQGQQGGAENSQLTVQNLPAHGHNVKCDTDTSSRSLVGDPVNNLMGNTSSTIYGGTEGSNHMKSTMIEDTGGNLPFNNMQPWFALNYIICVDGLYPPRP